MEGLKKAGNILRLHTGPGVGKRQQVVIAFQPAANPHPPIFREFDRIAEQIQRDLFQPTLIGDDCPHLGRDVHLQADAFLFGQGDDEFDHFLD